MSHAQQMGIFIARASFDQLSLDAREQLKIRVLDSLGCALGALGAAPADRIRKQCDEFGGAPLCTLIGGGRTAPDRAAFYNSALVRYLDFNDSYLAKGETCHPSDNLGAVLAAAEYGGASGRDFLTALAVAYQVQCRLSDAAPVRQRGFDHTSQGAFAVAAGVSKALGLDAHRAAHALAICGTAFHALRVTRTGELSNWKGLAYPNTSFGCTHAAFLAMRGITGPLEVFEGNKGFMQTISGPFEIDWAREDVEAVRRTATKKYNAEIHSQSAIEGILDLREQHRFAAQDIERVDLETFDVAFQIIGGGEEGEKKSVATKEAADHSLPYILAAALLDGTVMPAQYEEERIRRADIQALLQRIEVRPSGDLSARFPREMPCRLSVRLRGGASLAVEKKDYEGFPSRPASWDSVARKFDALAAPHTSAALRRQIRDTVAQLETVPISRLVEQLQQASERAREAQPHGRIA